MGNAIYKMRELYEDYEELCKHLKIKPKMFNEPFIDHFIFLKSIKKHRDK